MSRQARHRDFKETVSIMAGAASTPGSAADVTHDRAASVVAATLRAMLGHAALDRLPHAAPGLSQRLPRLLGELGCALRRSLCRARKTTVATPGRARTGRSRLAGLVAALPGVRPRRSLGALLVPARRRRMLSVTRAFGPLSSGVTRPLVPPAFRTVATWRAALRLTALRLTALRLPPIWLPSLRMLALRMRTLRTPTLRLLALRMRALGILALRMRALRMLALRMRALRILALRMLPLWLLLALRILALLLRLVGKPWAAGSRPGSAGTRSRTGGTSPGPTRIRPTRIRPIRTQATRAGLIETRAIPTRAIGTRPARTRWPTWTRPVGAQSVAVGYRAGRADLPARLVAYVVRASTRCFDLRCARGQLLGAAVHVVDGGAGRAGECLDDVWVVVERVERAAQDSGQLLQPHP